MQCENRKGRALSGLVTVVRRTPADDLEDEEDHIGKQKSDGDGVESNTGEDTLLEVLAQEEEDELWTESRRTGEEVC